MPIFKSPNPSSCTECHPAGVDLENYIKPSHDKTFLSLRDQGLIDLENQADVLIEGGAELEIGWLPPLENSARNSRILGGASSSRAVCNCAKCPPAPWTVRWAMHPLGNPHFWLDPVLAKTMAARLANVSQLVAALKR